jgi:3-hydroxyisobutyrate dehydrogenase
MASAVGFIGLGNMGLPMAISLLKAGFKVTGHSLNNLDRFAENGGLVASTPAQCAIGKEFVVNCLPGSAAVLDEVVNGPEGLAVGMKPGSILIETSNHPVDAKRNASAVLAARNVELLECEVTGVPNMVAARKCAFFISGASRQAFERSLPILDAITTTEKRYLGPLGTASSMKLISNSLTCIHLAAAAEALALGTKAGLDPESMLALFKIGGCGSVMLAERGPRMIARKFDDSDGSFNSLKKFPPAVQELAKHLGMATPMLDSAADLFRLAVESGRGDQDVAALVEIIEALQGRSD